MSTSNLESHVVSLELAKALKTARYPQESLFYWKIDQLSTKPPIVRLGELGSEAPSTECIAAPLVSEIGELLPKTVLVGNTLLTLTIEHWSDHWGIRYGNEIAVSGEANESEADARARMWLFLHKEGSL